MIASLRESKAKLSELILRAEHGEEVLITVRGKPRARLVGVRPAPPASMRSWKRRLQKIQNQYALGKPRLPADQIIDELRAERA